MGLIDSTLSLLPTPAAEFARTAHLDNPLNLFLVFLALNLISSLFPSTQLIPSPASLSDKPTQYNWRPKEHPSPTVWRKWTPKELEKFDGTKQELEEGRLLMAIRRKVYDVSSGKSFYGPGGPYSNFGGRDASRGLAKQSFEEDMLTSTDKPIDPLDDLTKSEWDNLRGWEDHFRNKYILCGDLVEA